MRALSPVASLLALALLAACDAYVLQRPAPLSPRATQPQRHAAAAARPPHLRPFATAKSKPPIGLAMCAASDQPAIDVDATTDSGSEEDAVTSKATGIRAWFSKWMKFDREQLGKLGVDAFFTYGVVSNMNAAITVALAGHVLAHDRLVTAPGMWTKFGATYFAIYLSLGSPLPGSARRCCGPHSAQ